jgi:2-keto-4-pentenoate hydratase/2-oxohepta-3-ene-1,7-dioic acid hydratase in catechol pathway
VRLVRFVRRDDSTDPVRPRIGLLVPDDVGDAVVDLSAVDPSLPDDVVTLLREHEHGDALGARLDALAARATTRHAAADVRLLAPLGRPAKVLAIARNYSAHAAERGGLLADDFPVFFNKQTSCLVGPDDAIVIPRVSEQVDYEGELGVVIGRTARSVTPDAARACIAGYTVVNDVSVRDWQKRAPTMTLGKSFDTHGPIGPVLVTADEIADPQALRIRAWVNGDLRQDDTTASMLHDCAHQISVLSTACTLEPGDLIATGTPAGVGAAFDPPRWLRPGDVVTITIDGVGTLSNPVTGTNASG